MTWPIWESLIDRIWIVGVVVWYPRLSLFLHVNGRTLGVDRVTRNDSGSAHICRPATVELEHLLEYHTDRK